MCFKSTLRFLQGAFLFTMNKDVLSVRQAILNPLYYWKYTIPFSSEILISPVLWLKSTDLKKAGIIISRSN